MKLFYIILPLVLLVGCKHDESSTAPSCAPQPAGFDYQIDYEINGQPAKNVVYSGDFEDFYAFDASLGCYVLAGTHEININGAPLPYLDVNAQIRGSLVSDNAGGYNFEYIGVGQNVGMVTAFGVTYDLLYESTVLESGALDPIRYNEYGVLPNSTAAIGPLSSGVTVTFTLVIYDYYKNELSRDEIDIVI